MMPDSREGKALRTCPGKHLVKIQPPANIAHGAEVGAHHGANWSSGIECHPLQALTHQYEAAVCGAKQEHQRQVGIDHH